jgi:hypothetical protein
LGLATDCGHQQIGLAARTIGQTSVLAKVLWDENHGVAVAVVDSEDSLAAPPTNWFGDSEPT